MGHGYPSVNVWTNTDGAIVTAELPGIDTEELDISVRENVLTITGNRSATELQEGAVYHRRERSHGKFQRILELPFIVDTAGVEANYEKGVLRILLPRAEADKPRKISVTSV
jgi:HSP20 family protein